MPLIDASGSTIALVNAASNQSPATSFTYDPFGSMSSNGASTNWPFLFEGGEHEFTDPGSLYYDGSGNYYNPQIMRSLSETSQTSSSGNNGGPSGNAIARPSGGGGGVPSAALDAGVADAANNAALLGTYGALELLGQAKLAAALLPLGPIPAIIATAALVLFDIFDAIFGGGSDTPPTPRQLLHARHPLYPVILGVPEGLIPTEGSEGLKICGDPHPSSSRPLQKQSAAPSSTPSPSPTPAPIPTWPSPQWYYPREPLPPAPPTVPWRPGGCDNGNCWKPDLGPKYLPASCN